MEIEMVGENRSTVDTSMVVDKKNAEISLKTVYKTKNIKNY